jgi:DNA polymerase-3 subunit gamma/tau
VRQSPNTCDGMSLYRAWRPKSFADLVGQDAVVRTLTTAIDTGRLAHAYLFSGPRGSGKTSAAKILARCIECVHGPTAAPDNECENCRAILAGTALDVLEIDAASNRGIDEIRALRDAVKFAPATMRMKVYIIDEAHMLTKEGANAFLKTLEEPPPYAVFILATTAPEALPPTILSRCQRYAFRRIPIETMIARMRTISDAEGIVIDDGALGAIAYRADGGLRDALTMLEQVAAFANGPVDVDIVEAAFGQTGRAFARRLLGAALAGDAGGALAAIDDASNAGTDMAGLIRGTIAEFRHLLVARINPELLGRDLSGDDATVALEQGRATPQARLIRGLRLLSDALAAARGSGNARLEIETATLRFILQHEDPSLDALAARVAALESGSGGTVPAERAAATRPQALGPPVSQGRPAPGPPSSSAAPSRPEPTAPARPEPTAPSRLAPIAPSPPEPISLNKIRSLWQNVRTRVASQKVTLSAALAHTNISAFDGEILTLAVPDRTLEALLKTNIATLHAAIDGVLGRRLEIRIRVENGRNAPVEAGADGSDDAAALMRYAIDTLP